MRLTEAEKEQMAEENVKLVYYVVNSYLSTNISQDELQSVAFLGYAKALDRFENDRGVKFSTYAINVMKNEILFFLRHETKHRRNGISMNFALSKDEFGRDLLIEDTIDPQEDDEKSLEDMAVLNEYGKILHEIIAELPDKERYILTYRFGLAGGVIKTQREIAEVIDMSQANVSKIEKNIIDKMRKIMKSEYHIHENV